MKNIFTKKNVFFFTLILILYRYFIVLLFYSILFVVVYFDRGSVNVPDILWICFFLTVPILALSYMTIWVVVCSYACISYDEKRFLVNGLFKKVEVIPYDSIDLILVSRSAIGSYFFRKEVCVISLRVRRENWSLMSIFPFGFRDATDVDQLLKNLGKNLPISIGGSSFF